MECVPLEIVNVRSNEEYNIVSFSVSLEMVGKYSSVSPPLSPAPSEDDFGFL